METVPDLEDVVDVDVNAVLRCGMTNCEEPATVRVTAKRDICRAHDSVMCTKHFVEIYIIYHTNMIYRKVRCGKCESIIVNPGESFDSAIEVKDL